MLNGILENTLDDIPKAAKDFHILLETLAEKIAKKEKRELESVLITCLQMIEHTSWSVKQVRTYTRILLDYENLELVNGFIRGQRHFYKTLRSHQKPIEKNPDTGKNRKIYTGGQKEISVIGKNH